ncbi:MAG: hypothetical protein CMI18_09175 [Opitutaceae bacterium]|nr:hypothetical protein [Opitutaceae bacterium]
MQYVNLIFLAESVAHHPEVNWILYHIFNYWMQRTHGASPLIGLIAFRRFKIKTRTTSPYPKLKLRIIFRALYKPMQKVGKNFVLLSFLESVLEFIAVPHLLPTK